MYPHRLNDNQREMAARYLAVIPAEQRQGVLDELEGRIRAEQQGAKPVYDELRYLHRLCAQVNAGGFQPNLGLKVQRERSRRAQAVVERRQDAQAEPVARQTPQGPVRSATGEASLAEARKILGRSPAKSRPDD